MNEQKVILRGIEMKKYKCITCGEISSNYEYYECFECEVIREKIKEVPGNVVQNCDDYLSKKEHLKFINSKMIDEWMQIK